MKNLIVARLLLVTAVGLVGSRTLAQAQGSGNPAPRAPNGYPVDECLHWAADCGKSAADQYCRDAGYPGGAVHFQKAQMRQTWVLGDNKACGAHDKCIGFTSIQCSGSPGPRLDNGYSVDWCLRAGASAAVSPPLTDGARSRAIRPARALFLTRICARRGSLATTQSATQRIA